MNRAYRLALDAFYAFNDDDGWAIASHIALSALMALFPFLIFVTALAALFGTKELADATAMLLLQSWPKEVAEPIASAIHDVLTNLRTDALTFGVLFAVYFSSSGIESLRIGLNRAYGVRETHSWWWMRIESILYVFVGAVSLLALAFLIVLGPLIWATATKYAPWLKPFAGIVDLTRYGLTSFVLVVALIVVHKWLPAGRRSFAEIAPGIVVTLVLWIAAGALFGSYLSEFAYTYVTYYAGLASAMIALVFLYVTASIFVYGGELNSVIRKEREARP
ncbi:MAG TPA: YihY/virulence factor BrkB family protein [Xanthobacteraceae bacterium]|nr:YihY/virulence factor BrkB family protein [Xanthobacteraceae bacterium]